MPILEKHTSLLLGIWKVEESVPELLELLGEKEEYLSVLNTYKAEVRRKEYLVTCLLLKDLLGCETELAHHADGAPYRNGRNFQSAYHIQKAMWLFIVMQPGGWEWTSNTGLSGY